MKAEEAPEKIYLYETKINDIISYRGISLKGRDNDIEYIRKDAFIEEVIKYLYGNNKGFILTEKDIEDFRKYLKKL